MIFPSRKQFLHNLFYTSSVLLAAAGVSLLTGMLGIKSHLVGLMMLVLSIIIFALDLLKYDRSS